MIRIDGYNHPPRVCTICKDSYTPTGATQKYCVGCKDVGRRRVSMEWWKAHGREYDKDYKQQFRKGPYPEAQYIRNDITEKTDFLDNVRTVIRRQRGDMIGTKKLVNRVLKDMKIESVSWGARKVCCRAVEKVIVDEFKGVYYNSNRWGGVTFKLPKERLR